jgi:hypothetical protein
MAWKKRLKRSRSHCMTSARPRASARGGHDLAPTGGPAPITLPSVEIRADAETRLRPAERDAKAGHHLIEDEDGAMARASLAC